MKVLSEAAALTGFFFSDKPYDLDADVLLGKRFKNQPRRAIDALDQTISAVETLPSWNAPELEAAIEPLAERLEIKRGDLYGLLRVAVTGRTVSPPLFESMESSDAAAASTASLMLVAHWTGRCGSEV